MPMEEESTDDVLMTSTGGWSVVALTTHCPPAEGYQNDFGGSYSPAVNFEPIELSGGPPSLISNGSGNAGRGDASGSIDETGVAE